MTPDERSTLLAACAFAKVFLDDADAELRGGRTAPRVNSQLCLTAALQNLEDADANVQ